ncbi:MAG: hypothetical protein C5B47_03370 [Verrucomicrobia bacterium]|nr:MAG: hypothetical protein C5B47_03370 [Verrucomicrobiota bacterium]
MGSGIDRPQSMKVLVTGGSGLIGHAVTKRLVQHNWDVRLLDAEIGERIPGVEYVTCDILNFDDVRVAMRGRQAVVHLAAIPRPGLAPGEKVFAVNVSGTFNVFEAAAAEGIKRVVHASSINALGVSFSLTDIVVEYLPIDEEHPAYTTDPYSLSKQLVEDIGAYYWRRDQISSVALRFPGVHREGRLKDEQFLRYRKKAYEAIVELAALDRAERERKLAPIRERALAWRKQRPMEFRGETPAPLKRESPEDILFHIYAVDRFNFWASVDERDAAQAIEKGLTASFDGAHPLFISDNHNWLGYESKALAELFFPHLNETQVALSGTVSLLSIEKARRLIGFEPEYSLETQQQSIDRL